MAWISSIPSTRRRPPTSSRFGICAAGLTASRRRAASTTSTRWRPTWAAWASSPSHHAEILHNNLLISTHTLEAARQNGVGRYLYTSSACVYPEYRQTDADVEPLKEEEAYPAQPQDAYGWEKLITERLCLHYREDYGMETRIVRFHNIFGPLGTWDGGREKAPAAMCRKVAIAKLTGNHEIEIWGDGEQTRSFCYIDDCVDGHSAPDGIRLHASRSTSARTA